MLPPRSALFLPASNARAVEKARGLPADLVILDLEDAVAPANKLVARDAAQAFEGRSFAVRVNGLDTEWHEADLHAVRASKADLVVLPKAESRNEVDLVASATGRPVVAMIETPRAVLDAAAIAGGCAGLFAGTNDLAAQLRLPAGREGLTLSLQMMVLAARAAGIWVLDGVFNALDDAVGLESQCIEGRMLGFDGKTLIHPNQIEIANRAFSPSEAELAEAHALVEATAEGAVRYQDRMIETLHVDAARALIARAGR